MIKKGEYHDVLMGVIKLCESSHGVVPEAILLGPDEYYEYCSEITQRVLMGEKLHATKVSIGRVPILITPSSGIDFAFSTTQADKLKQNLIDNEVKEEYAKEEVK